MYFGELAYETGFHSGNVYLGTNGQITYTGSGISHDGFGNAARITIFSNSFDVVEVRCNATATVALDNNPIDVTSIEASINVPRPWNSAPKCDGVAAGDDAIGVLDTRTRNFSSVYFGGQMQIPANSLISGSYSSRNIDGVPLRISVTIQ